MILTLNAEIATDHAAVADQLIHDFGGQFDRNGEAEALRRFAVGDFVIGQGVDADQLAQRVDQRTAGVAAVD